MIDFSLLSDIASPDFKDAMEIYLESFPQNERQPLHKIKHRVECGFYSMIVAKRDTSVVGFSLACPFPELRFGLLDYIAVRKDRRNLGIGSKLFQKTGEFFLKEVPSAFILFEVENPAYGDFSDSAIRHRRLGFYRRLGARAINNFNYIMPPMVGNSPTEMVLMVFSRGSQVDIDSRYLKDIVTAVYRRVYERAEDDPFLRRMLDSLSSGKGSLLSL